MNETDELIHVCEVCGVEKIMTPQQAFDEGWDYPPRLGEFGVISPRTCVNHPITETLYWKLITQKDGESYEPTEEEIVFIKRVLAEPESITPKPKEGTPDVQ